MSSSKSTNQIVQNLYRFLIDLLPLKNVEMPNLSHLSFSTRGLGWFVNQRNPAGYWRVTKGDLSQIISFLHDFFCLGLAFSSVWLRAVISDRFFYSEFASFCRAQLEFSYFLFLSKTPWRWEVKSRKFQLVPLTIGGEIAKILSSSIDDSLSAWIGLLDAKRIRTLVNLLYLGIRDNHWNYVNFETLETHCN